MGKEKKRKRSRSPSRERKRADAKTDAELQKMQLQIHNLTNLLHGFMAQKERDSEVDSNKENDSHAQNALSIDNDESRQQDSVGDSRQEEQEKDEEVLGENPKGVDDKILNLLGDDPNVTRGEGGKLHPEIKNRWQTWMKAGLSEEDVKSLTKKYSRKGDLYAEPPKLNLEIGAAMTEIAKKRDGHFVQTQECVGTAIVALGAAISLLVDESDDEVDQMKLIELLSDTGKLLTDIFHRQSVGRKSFINPMMKKSVKSVVEANHSDEWLYGQNLAEQIKEVKTVETVCQNIKAPEKKPPYRAQNQGNWKGPSGQHRQTGGYHRKQFIRFKQRTPYRSTPMNRDKNRSMTKESSKK